ncbi:hypothetical protein B0H63DRAFT_560949 [Podospora didyma]|uniref:Uncharacterized protein n=1 Tax=Podospora didyma TaxID=330526 RepID=A0AAE0TVU2_9PEZI|nr:hypothetical protein B0H63DRAFT_560949 [Podospora didyma]
MSSLTRLNVILNEASYHHRDPGIDVTFGIQISTATHSSALLPLRSQPSQQFYDLLDEWHVTAAYLSSHVGIGRLELSLVCDRECGECECLSSPPKPDKTSSALTDLPRELRLHILEYTDLITPWKEVSWSRQGRGYMVFRPYCQLSHEQACPPDVHHGCKLYRCQGDGPSSPGCFCRCRHAAFSLACKCWAPPTNLFLLFHFLTRDAQFVFFSGNRFIVHDFHADPSWDMQSDSRLEPLVRGGGGSPGTTEQYYYYQYEGFAASEFLQDVVLTHCLADLCFLELIFLLYGYYAWPHNNHAPVLDWRATVGTWLQGKIDAPALTIRLVMVDDDDDDGRELTGEQVQDIMKGRACIVGPRDETPGAEGHGPEWLENAEQHLKKYNERCIWVDHPRPNPGHRAEPPKSVWQRIYEADLEE